MFWIFKSIAEKLDGNPYKIPVNNFGTVVDRNLYRSALPSINALIAMQKSEKVGITHVLDLRNLSESEFYARRRAVQSLGLKYTNIGMDEYHEIPQELVHKAVDLLTSNPNDVFIVHCKGGIHRTGLVILAYRMWVMGYSWDQAYKEAKNYHFYTGNNHGGVLISMKRAGGQPVNK